ncbi:MAG: hypothetical protein HOW73_25555 [Polyangiaceae bacterium]|nr:hypothetical protein [Polyangiaceae bacterium]
MRALRCAVFGVVIASGCAPARNVPPPSAPRFGMVAYPQPAPAPMPAPSAPAVGVPNADYREKVAVLPLADDDLFRAERTSLREKLSQAIGRVSGSELEIVPMTEVDKAIAPVSKSGARCASSAGSLEMRAHEHGWLATQLKVAHVLRGKDELIRELNVSARASWAKPFHWMAPWPSNLSTAASYEQAIVALKPDPHGQEMMLAALNGRPRNNVRFGTVSLCESPAADCASETKQWSDAASEMEACFAGADEVGLTLLVQGGSSPRCEIVNDHEATPEESCLCKAALASKRMASLAKRTRLDIDFEAKDIAGKERPLLSIIDVTANVRTEEDWEPARDGARKRLIVEGLDALAAPLARCARGDDTVVAELAVDPTGKPTSAQLTLPPSSKGARACLEKALVKSAFDCTKDGQAATIRVAIRSARTATAETPKK